jgi:hypothetical protein
VGRRYVCAEGRDVVTTRGVVTFVRCVGLVFALGVDARRDTDEGFFVVFAGLRAAGVLDFAVVFFFSPANAVDDGQAMHDAITTITHTRVAAFTCKMVLWGENMSSPLAVDSDHDRLRSLRFSPHILDSFFMISFASFAGN